MTLATIGGFIASIPAFLFGAAVGFVACLVMQAMGWPPFNKWKRAG